MAPLPQTPFRDRIVVLGRRRSGKTIFLARLYESLWQGCTFVDGEMLAGHPSLRDEQTKGTSVVRMSCRAMTGAAHLHFMKIIEEMRAGRWPLATQGNVYAEIVVTFAGRDHVVTALDYPGEVFRKAFLLDSDDPDALELRGAVDRAAAAVLLIDPSVVASGGAEAHDDTFGLMQAVTRLRSGHGGESIPVAIVFTKSDTHSAFLREAGGVRAFAKQHFSQLFSKVARTAVFPSAAVRESRNALGKTMPDLSRLPEGVVEPLRYCLDHIGKVEHAVAERDRNEARMKAKAEEARRVVVEESRAKTRSTLGWTTFAVGTLAALAGAVVVALRIAGKL